MPASLAEQLYHRWRRAQHDITEHPAWGNLESEQRLAWEAVAEEAREQLAMAARFDATLAQEREKRTGILFAPVPIAQAPTAPLADVLAKIEKLRAIPSPSLLHLESYVPPGCEEPIPCGQCDWCHAEAKRDNAAREQPPAFTGTVDELEAKLVVDVFYTNSAAVDAMRNHILHGATSTRTEIEDAAAEKIAAHIETEMMPRAQRDVAFAALADAVDAIRSRAWRPS